MQMITEPDKTVAVERDLCPEEGKEGKEREAAQGGFNSTIM